MHVCAQSIPTRRTLAFYQASSIRPRIQACNHRAIVRNNVSRPGLPRLDGAGNSGTCPSTRGPRRRYGTLAHASFDEISSNDTPSHDISEAMAADPQTAQYSLNFLWLDKNLAVSVDQVFGRGHRSPITEYFFWPREDAWERLKTALEEKDWIGHQEKVELLNTCTEVINYWQDGERPSVQDAIARYPNCSFQG